MSKLAEVTEINPMTLENYQSQPGAGAVLQAFYERLASQLSKADLEWLSGAASGVEIMASNWSDLLTGLGCLMVGDADKDSIKVGSFADVQSITNLLFESANAFDTIKGLSHVASSASYRLNHFDELKEFDNARKAR